MSRATEIVDINPDRRVVWLAGEVDELESEFTKGINKLIASQESGRRLLTGVLVAIIAALIVFPTTVIMFVVTGR